jgi:serine/threonine protein kinase
MPPTACLDLAAIRKLAGGSLSAAQANGLLQHIENCTVCAKKLGSLPKDDTLFGTFGAETLAGDTAMARVARLIQRLRGEVPREEQITRAPPAPPAGGPTVDAKTYLPSAGRPKESRSAAVDAPSVDRALYDFLAPPEADDELGRLGPYRVLKVLGAGGMGVVFKAEDPMLQRPVALKAMLPTLAVSATARERFLREARSAASIKHDHIVHIYQVGEDRGVPFLAMEFLDGEPLDERLKRPGPMPLSEVLRIGREVAEGLEAAHTRGLVHRDIKPANIWLEGERGRVKILDFGLARSASGQSQLTQSGAIIGTPAYMAPEQAQGKSVDHRCDLFSLGGVLYRIVTGKMPFKGADTISTLMAVATHNPPAPQRLRAEMPHELSDLVMTLLAKDPAERPASARAVAETLASLAQPQTMPPPTARPAVATMVKPPRSEPSRTVKRPAAPERTGIAKQGKGRRSPIVWIVAAVASALGLLGIAACVLGAFLLRIQSADGTLVLEADDDVQVRVLQGGKQLTLLDTRNNTEVRLAAGTYELELAGGKEGLKLQTKQFMLKRGDREIARVRFEPRADAAPKTPLVNPSSKAPPPTGFVSLFNGKDLTGWKPSPNWRVNNGVLYGSGPASSYLYSKRADFKDFHLIAEVRINDRGNSGIFFRSEFAEPFPRGFEAQINSTHGDPVRTGSLHPFNLNLSQEERKRCVVTEQLHKPDEWFTLEVLAQQNHITLRVNGKTTADYFDAKERFTQGHLALQQHDAQCQVAFRRIEIKELPTTAESSRSFFNGKDLNGWRGLPGRWSVKDGAIVGAPVAGAPAHTFLVSEKSYRDFDLRFQVRRKDGIGNSGVQFRSQIADLSKFSVVGPQCEIDSASVKYPPGSLVSEPNGKPFAILAPQKLIAQSYKDADFNEFRIRCAGKYVLITVNGITAIDGTFPELPNEGVIAWQLHGTRPPTEVIFRNIEFVDLNP